MSEILDRLELQVRMEPTTAAYYRWAKRLFCDFIGRDLRARDFREVSVNRWVCWLEEHYSPQTSHNLLTSLLRIWNFCAELGECSPYHPKRIRRVKVPQPIVRTLCREDAHKLLRACQEMPGKLKCGIAASVVMEAYCRLNWQAGMRQRDLPRLKRSNFDAEGRITFVQSKTRRRHVVLVDPTTMEAVNACFRPDCDRVFPIGRWGLTEHKRKAWKAAGLDRPAAFSRLRKNFATAIAARDGLEAAARALGHISGTTVARTWYVDPVALDQPAQPPDLT